MNAIIKGIHYFFSGFGLITKPGLRRFVVVPVLINFLLFIGLFFLLMHYLQSFNQWVAAYLPVWLQWLEIIIWLLFLASFMLLFVYTFVAIANLIASPLYSFLSEKVELVLTGHSREKTSLFANIKGAPQILKRQAAIIFYYLPRALICLLLFFLPVVHLFAGFIWLIFNAWFLTLTVVDYPTDAHQVPLDEVKTWLRARRLTALGFGSIAVLFAMVPIVNLFVLPAAVAGATKFWLEEGGK